MTYRVLHGAFIRFRYYLYMNIVLMCNYLFGGFSTDCYSKILHLAHFFTKKIFEISLRLIAIFSSASLLPLKYLSRTTIICLCMCLVHSFYHSALFHTFDVFIIIY